MSRGVRFWPPPRLSRQVDRAVGGAQIDQRTAIAKDRVQVIAADLTLHPEIEIGGDAGVAGAGGNAGVDPGWHMHGDSAIAGMGAEVIAEIGRQGESDAAIRGLDTDGTGAMDEGGFDAAI